PEGLSAVSLSQNESLRPPSPQAIEAAAAAVGGAELYPDPEWTALRHALADAHAIPAQDILCSAGSLDLIGAIARVYAGPERAILAPAHAYPFFRTAAQMAGARFDTAPERAMTAHVDSLLAALRPDTGIVFLANPANPTGTRLPRAEVRRLHAGLPADVLLVLDEAYGEFSDALSEPNWDLPQTGNCIVLRTFSKAYGLAGLRLGWGLCPGSITQELHKVLNPNAVTAVSQAAALAALEDQAYMRETCTLTADLRDKSAAFLQDTGLRVVESHTNFLLLPFETADRAMDLEAFLTAQGVFLRRQGGAGLPAALRMTVGPAQVMARVLDEIGLWAKGER
ncbi:MAG: histidinol-phosphate transaminase, partial [Roseobacter sp.]|nr:histidinol-phosphate transaminase [Roseobacter sp.]